MSSRTSSSLGDSGAKSLPNNHQYGTVTTLIPPPSFSGWKIWLPLALLGLVSWICWPRPSPRPGLGSPRTSTGRPPASGAVSIELAPQPAQPLNALKTEQTSLLAHSPGDNQPVPVPQKNPAPNSPTGTEETNRDTSANKNVILQPNVGSSSSPTSQEISRDVESKRGSDLSEIVTRPPLVLRRDRDVPEKKIKDLHLEVPTPRPATDDVVYTLDNPTLTLLDYRSRQIKEEILLERTILKNSLTRGNEFRRLRPGYFDRPGSLVLQAMGRMDSDGNIERGRVHDYSEAELYSEIALEAESRIRALEADDHKIVADRRRVQDVGSQIKVRGQDQKTKAESENVDLKVKTLQAMQSSLDSPSDQIDAQIRTLDEWIENAKRQILGQQEQSQHDGGRNRASYYNSIIARGHSQQSALEFKKAILMERRDFVIKNRETIQEDLKKIRGR